MGRWHYSRLRHALYAAWQVNDKRLANCHSSAFIRFPAWETWKILEESPLPQDVVSFLCQQRVDLPCTQSSMRNRTGCGIQKIYPIVWCLCVCVCLCLCTGIGWNWNSFIGFVHRYCIPVPSCSYPSYPGKHAVGLDLMQVRKDTEYETLPWCEPRHCFQEVILFPKGKRNINIINTMSHMKTLHRGARNLARFRFVDVVME